jgi:hypothetical protein
MEEGARQEAPPWLVEAIQHNPAALRKALASDPKLLLTYYFGTLGNLYVVELTYCALLGKNAAEALELLLEYGPPQWRTTMNHEVLMTGIVSASFESGLHTPKARRFVCRIARQCSMDIRNNMLQLSIDLKRSSVAHALVRAGATIPEKLTVAQFSYGRAALHAELLVYSKQLAQQRRALLVFIGLRKFRHGPFAHGKHLAALPLELMISVARFAWSTDEEVSACRPSKR